MAFQPGVPRPANAGRKAGTKNKKNQAIEDFARSIVEHPEVQSTIAGQAIRGELPTPLLQMLYYYAYGKPVEHKQVDVTQRIDVRVTSTLSQALGYAYHHALPAADGG
jgi:hypothetical protein